MLKDDQLIRVKNLTGSSVVYRIPEDNIRRSFNAFEEKEITYGELQKLYYRNGGDILIRDYLQIQNKEAATEFGVDPESFENEYSWDKNKVDSVLTTEHIDVLHDALDFAPEGIIDLIVSEAIRLRIVDINKRDLIQQYTGKNITKMIDAQVQLEKELGDEKKEEPKRRRVTKKEETEESLAEEPKRRRTSASTEGESLFS